mgnify:CR=1 FL=1
MVTLSILTPTYNRVKTLKRLYKSLLSQKNKDFEWIVIDDGSTDLTQEYMQEVVQCSEFKITYKYKENGEKHRALNYGIDCADSKLIICVDSDNWLPENSVETIISFYKERCMDQNGVIGIIAKRGYIYNDMINDLTVVETDINRMTLYDFCFNYKCSGDTALVYYIELLKNNKFSEYLGETFVSENALYFQLDQYGKMMLLNEIVYLNEYQKDGLTANYRKLLEDNPNGTAYMYYIYSISTSKQIERIKYLGLANYYMNRSKPNCQMENSVRTKLGGDSQMFRIYYSCK